MPDKGALDSLVARIRSTNWQDNDLANAVAVGVSSVARHNTFVRGLHDNTIADHNGGTLLAVGDNSAGRQSLSMQQPQRMSLQRHGAIATRQQGRAELTTRTVPATVLGVSGTGANAVLTVAMIANKPKLLNDNSSGTLVVGDPLNDAYQSVPFLAANSQDIREVRLAGQSFQTGTVGGTQLPSVGQTIMVSVAESSEKRTFWVTKNGRNFPRVIDYPISSTVSLMNGLRSVEGTTPITCTPALITRGDLTALPTPVGYSLAAFQGDGIGCPNSFWRLACYNEVYVPAVDNYPWYAAGRIDANGKLVGLPSVIYADPRVTPNVHGIMDFYLENGCQHSTDIWWFESDTITGDAYQFHAPFVKKITPVADFMP